MVTAIRWTLPSLLATLEREVADKGDAVARGLLQTLKCYKFVATLYLLSDVLPLLSKLSLIFQRENIDLCVVRPAVSSTIAAVKVLRDTPGVYLKQLDETVDKLQCGKLAVAKSPLRRKNTTRRLGFPSQAPNRRPRAATPNGAL